MYEVREVLRLWLDGEGLRSIERLSAVDRKTVRRYVTAAEGLGLDRDGGGGQLSDVFVGLVVEAVRPHRSDGRGEAWRLLEADHDRVAGWVDEGLTALKIHELLARRGTLVPLRTVQRYVAEACGRRRGQGAISMVWSVQPGQSFVWSAMASARTGAIEGTNPMVRSSWVWGSARSWAIASRACSIVAAWRTMARPAGVRRDPFADRWSSSVPAACSNALRCCETADGVRCSARAAAEMLPRRSTSSRDCSLTGSNRDISLAY